MTDSLQYRTRDSKPKRFRQGRMPLIVMALAVLLIASIALPVLGQERSRNAPNAEATNMPSYTALRQESRVFKQEILTASESERRVLVDAATRLMAKFDRRIERLQEKQDEQSADMSVNAQRYSQELMATMQEARTTLEERLPMLRADTEQDWDQTLYKFSKAYEAFCEAWADVEANLDPESV